LFQGSHLKALLEFPQKITLSIFPNFTELWSALLVPKKEKGFKGWTIGRPGLGQHLWEFSHWKVITAFFLTLGGESGYCGTEISPKLPRHPRGNFYPIGLLFHQTPKGP